MHAALVVDAVGKNAGHVTDGVDGDMNIDRDESVPLVKATVQDRRWPQRQAHDLSDLDGSLTF